MVAEPHDDEVTVAASGEPTPTPDEIADLISRIPDGQERIDAGLADLAAGRVRPIDEL